MKALLAALLVSVAGIGAAEAQDGLVGTWRGTALELLKDGRSQLWDVNMKIASPDSVEIEYPTLQCGGTLTFIRTVGDVREYREKLSYGVDKCVDGGTVGFSARNGKLIWYWSGENTADADSVDVGVLTRQ